MLASTLKRILSQVADCTFYLDIVVVDNDADGSAKPVVDKVKRDSNISIVYDCEPQQNIALARNRAVRNAPGNLIAFIDDDEIPKKDWLKLLYMSLKESGADGVLGPVIPRYPPDAPKWLRETDMFQRDRFPTGTRLSARYTRTGNVLLSRKLFENILFDPAYGLTGGEDVDFFERQVFYGKVFVWCDEAEVFELQPPERWRKSFFVRRYLRMGKVRGQLTARRGGSRVKLLLKSLIGMLGFIAAFAFALPLGPCSYMKFLVKSAYHFGLLCGLYGLDPPGCN